MRAVATGADHVDRVTPCRTEHGVQIHPYGRVEHGLHQAEDLAGGLGIARQLKDEIEDCPPTCVVIARAADRWLAAYARVDAALTHPLDPMTTGQTVASLLRNRAAGVPSLQ